MNMTLADAPVVALVTGSEGFLGKNLCAALAHERPETEVIKVSRETKAKMLEDGLRRATLIYHLAGVNRPSDLQQFKQVNEDFTRTVCSLLRENPYKPLLIYASSTQALLDNPYGQSKLAAEKIIAAYSQEMRHPAILFRIPNVFGKWCRPHYNSVVATFCYNTSHGLPLKVDDPSKKISLVYIDEVVAEFLSFRDKMPSESTCVIREMRPLQTLCVSDLAMQISEFSKLRSSALLPNVADPFTKALYSTYLTYLETPNFEYTLDRKSDQRGTLAEFIKSPGGGQVFISRTQPGVVRGNHFHHSKTEKFLVVEGQALIRFRHLFSDEIISFSVEGKEFRVLDIPPGYTHSIQNIGKSELITLFWANEIFDPHKPDTFPCEVLNVKT